MKKTSEKNFSQKTKTKKVEKHSWLDDEEMWTKDPEITKIRSGIKNGIIAYDTYMRQQCKLVQENAKAGNVMISQQKK